MCIRCGRSGTKSTQFDEKEETIMILRYVMRKEGDCLEKKIMQGIIPGLRMQGRSKMRWIDNMEKWAKMSFEKLRETEDRWRWSRLVREAVNHRNEDG